jgi:hypothetical protein
LIDKAPGIREKDMEKRPKTAVLAAISAAVTNYVKTQEEALAAAAMAAAAAGPTAAAGSFYGAYGRQQMMEMRRLLSLRLARR